MSLGGGTFLMISSGMCNVPGMLTVPTYNYSPDNRVSYVLGFIQKTVDAKSGIASLNWIHVGLRWGYSMESVRMHHWRLHPSSP